MGPFDVRDFILDHIKQGSSTMEFLGELDQNIFINENLSHDRPPHG